MPSRDRPSTELDALYRKYAADVFRFALYLSGNRGEAEDLTSETFVRAWTSPEPIVTATVKGYLFTIARNLFLQGLRRKSRQVALDPELRDPRADVSAQAEQESELRAALRELQRLPEIDRAALLMRAVHELPYEEIARALGLSLAAVKVKIHRARLAVARVRDDDRGDT
jgi:RNA polymerase sigma-70 factor (ECF subfamily)